MPVTTRNYSITEANPINILAAMETAFADLGWHSAEILGTLQTFTSTAGSVVSSQANKRYLVTQESTTGSGTGALFDVLRNGIGGIQTVTLLKSGLNYSIFGIAGASSSGNIVTVYDTTGILPGQVVTKINGTGTLQTNTVVLSVLNLTQFTISQVPTLALSAAALLFQDTLIIGPTSISGASYIVDNVTGVSGVATLVVPDNANLAIGQTVSGTNTGPLSVVTAVGGTTITVSKANIGTVNGSVTFSDQIIVTAGTLARYTGLTGTASGTQITNVVTSANISVGNEITIVSGTVSLPAGTNYISSITGSGPYTVTLQNTAGNFRGFIGAGNIVFKASKGNSTHWYDYDITTTPLALVWGVARVVNSADTLGTTYWGVMVNAPATAHTPVGGNAPIIYVKAMPGFQSIANSCLGVAGLDWYNSATMTATAPYPFTTQVCSSAWVPLTLRLRQSAIDSNFATFSFMEGNNVRFPFFFSKYNNALQPWSLNDVFLGSVYEIYQIQTLLAATWDSGIAIRTRVSALPKRQAEAGYFPYDHVSALLYSQIFYRTITGNRGIPVPFATVLGNYADISFYSRQYGDIQTNVGTTIPVFKNIPICIHYIPVPYYLPEEFVLVELPWANAAIGDTVTVSAGEIYTIIQVATNQITFSSLALCARTT